MKRAEFPKDFESKNCNLRQASFSPLISPEYRIYNVNFTFILNLIHQHFA